MANTLERNWLERTVTYAKCPKCESGVLDTRIPRGFIFKYLVFWARYKHYKCNTCEARVYLKDNHV